MLVEWRLKESGRQPWCISQERQPKQQQTRRRIDPRPSSGILATKINPESKENQPSSHENGHQREYNEASRHPAAQKTNKRRSIANFSSISKSEAKAKTPDDNEPVSPGDPE